MKKYVSSAPLRETEAPQRFVAWKLGLWLCLCSEAERQAGIGDHGHLISLTAWAQPIARILNRKHIHLRGEGALQNERPGTASATYCRSCNIAQGPAKVRSTHYASRRRSIS